MLPNLPSFTVPEAQTIGFMVALVGVIAFEAYDLVVNGTKPSTLPMILMLAAGLFYKKNDSPPTGGSAA